MDAKKTREFRRRLSSEQAILIKSLISTRIAESEIGVVKTEDEGDLATVSQEKGILSSLHESGFTRLRSIAAALNALDRGSYGQCSRCGEKIHEKRLVAVPWAGTCIRCQEATETERAFSRRAFSALDADREA